MTRVAIIGAGVIGTGWTARFLASGHEVRVWDPAPGFESRLATALTRIWPMVERAGLADGASIDNLTTAASLGEACSDADFVQECAPEDLAIKQALHADIDAATDASVVVASSSSGLLPSEIQSSMAHPGRCVVGHPFNPVYLLPLVEIVGGEDTAADTIEQASAMYESIGMKPLVVRREIEGYLSDRLQEAMWREILHLVNDDIATTGELDDAVIYGPGLRWALMGTCLTFHLAGGTGGMRHMLEQFGPALELPWTHLKAPALTDALIDKMVNGTRLQANGLSVDELERVRDECLIDLIEVVERHRARLRGGD